MTSPFKRVTINKTPFVPGYGKGTYGAGRYGIGADNTHYPAAATPDWVTIPVDDGNFSPINIGGTIAAPETLFGEGGFGEGGFDTPSQIAQPAAQPNWTVSNSK